ncbi:MAG: phospholipase D-like domain-containing protein [Verrucomicrobium sp.]|nr:phospholipase D-like domain-containing protein [Verrucomicrobium sp.]
MAGTSFQWLRTGDEAFSTLLAAIGGARDSVCLETYIFAVGEPGHSVLAALVQAARRGVSVRVLVDGLGSSSLDDGFFDPLRAAGGEVRVFNPLTLRRLPVRSHRKLLIVDRQTAFTGGFNVAPEYLGDGIRSGWRDIGVRLTGPVVDTLADTFEPLWERAGLRPPRFVRLRRRDAAACPPEPAPMDGLRVLALRAALRRVAARGGRVRILVPGKSDVAISQRAGRFLYGRLLRSGVEIREYGPQVLHAKLYRVDDSVFVGSSNLDTRSLHINHELMVRIRHPQAAAETAEWFDAAEALARPVDPATWARSRSWWERIRERWSFLVLSRIDPYVTRWLAEDPR